MINYDETGAWGLDPGPDESIDQLIGALRNMANDPNIDLDKKHPMNKQEGAENIIERSDLYYYVKGLIEQLKEEKTALEKKGLIEQLKETEKEKARVFLTHCREYGQESAKDYIEEDSNKNSLIERGKQVILRERKIGTTVQGPSARPISQNNIVSFSR